MKKIIVLFLTLGLVYTVLGQFVCGHEPQTPTHLTRDEYIAYGGVTLLEATDSAGWEKLVSDFNIPSIFLKGREDHFLAWRLNKGHTDGPLDPIPSNNDQIIIAEGLHKISIFHIDNEAQAFAIIHKNTEEIKH